MEGFNHRADQGFNLLDEGRDGFSFWVQKKNAAEVLKQKNKRVM
jgi:hypothetical protein